MHLQPDRDQAFEEQREITRIAQAVLARIGLPAADRDAMRYPGLIAVVNEVQRLPSAATAAQRHAAVTAVRAALIAAEVSTRRAHELGCPAWPVDLAPVEPHLCASLDRALAQIPPRPDRVIDVRVTGWLDGERAIFRTAADLLAQSWPPLLAELAVVIRQVALLRGYGITGFSDFAVQGTIFVNAERLEFRNGLPGALRLAENLVHEGAHNRCYAAAVKQPFLPAKRAGVLVDTPLRADPRPLWGLFQQLVVLCRSAELYHRVDLGAEFDTAVQARKSALTEQARQALNTLNAHANQLTDHGCAILDEAATTIGADV